MQSSNAPRYLRVKRRDKTYCLLCQESQTIASVKETLAGMIQQFDGSDDDDKKELPSLRLLRVVDHSAKQPKQEEDDEDDLILDDDETLASAKIVNNQVLHLVFCINDDEDEYEPVEVVSTELPLSSGAASAETN